MHIAPAKRVNSKQYDEREWYQGHKKIHIPRISIYNGASHSFGVIHYFRYGPVNEPVQTYYFTLGSFL